MLTEDTSTISLVEKLVFKHLLEGNVYLTKVCMYNNSKKNYFLIYILILIMCLTLS